MLDNFYYGCIQKWSRGSLERQPEPEMTMEGAGEVDEYEKAADFGTFQANLELYAEEILSLAPERGRVLDIGCGPAALLCRLAECAPGLDFTGIDLSEKMVQRARHRAHRLSLKNVRIEKQDALNMRFDSGFDLIFSTNFIHQLLAPDMASKVVRDALRLLNPGGMLMLIDLERTKSERSAPWFAKKFALPVGRTFYTSTLNSLRAAYSFDEFERILIDAGWKDFDHYHPSFFNFFQLACSRAPRKKVRIKRRFNSFSARLYYHLLRIYLPRRPHATQ